MPLRSAHINLALALLFTLLLSTEALWLFALSAHIARFMEIVAPIFWIVALAGVWFAYSHGRTLMVGVALFALGAALGAIAIN